MANGVEIRAAQLDDAAALTALAHAAKRRWGYPEAWIGLWRDDLTVRAEDVARGHFFCAVRGGRIVGFCALDGDGDGGRRELDHLWVDPAHMGTGVGRRLFAHALATARAAGATELIIAADPNADGFYVKMGAVRIGTVPSRPEGRVLPLLVVELARGR